MHLICKLFSQQNQNQNQKNKENWLIRIPNQNTSSWVNFLWFFWFFLGGGVLVWGSLMSQFSLFFCFVFFWFWVFLFWFFWFWFSVLVLVWGSLRGHFWFFRFWFGGLWWVYFLIFSSGFWFGSLWWVRGYLGFSLEKNTFHYRPLVSIISLRKRFSPKYVRQFILNVFLWRLDFSKGSSLLSLKTGLFQRGK